MSVGALKHDDDDDNDKLLLPLFAFESEICIRLLLQMLLPMLALSMLLLSLLWFEDKLLTIFAVVISVFA